MGAVLRRLPIAWRITVLVLLGAGLVLLAVSVDTFVQARDLLKQQQRAEITQALPATANRIEVVESSVEKAVQGLALSVDDLEPSPRRAEKLL